MTTSTKNPAKKKPELTRTVLKGVPASPGFAMGSVFPVTNRKISVVEETLPESRLADEEQLFLKAVHKTVKEVSQIKEISEGRTGMKDSLIFATHLMILQDPSLINGTLDKIRKERKNARWAVHVVLGAYIDKFEQIDSPAMRDKAADLRGYGWPYEPRGYFGPFAPDTLGVWLEEFCSPRQSGRYGYYRWLQRPGCYQSEPGRRQGILQASGSL